MTTTAIAYCRISVSNDGGVSLEDQRAKIAAYATLYGITVVGYEVDDGRSASSLDRPALARALGMLRARKVDALIVTKLDRLSRSVRDISDLVERYFTGRRARALLSVHEQIDTRSASGRGVINILGSVGQMERELIGERTASAMAHLRATGRHTGGQAPLGYRVEAGALVEVPEEQAVVAEVRALAARGLSMRAIAATIAEAGRELRGAPSVGKIQRVLSAAPRPSALAA